MSYAILLIDGDGQRRETLARQLALFGEPAIAHAGSGKEALEQVAGRRFDAILVEADLPDMSGGDFCWLVRRRDIREPMLVLGEDSESKLVLALESGADDYIGRPFGLSVLLARLRAHLRQQASTGDDRLRLGPFIYFSSAQNWAAGDLPRAANQGTSDNNRVARSASAAAALASAFGARPVAPS
jgi:DNA-binding response OmpR family regulator